jgi:hypothetical protein
MLSLSQLAAQEISADTNKVQTTLEKKDEMGNMTSTQQGQVTVLRMHLVLESMH